MLGALPNQNESALTISTGLAPQKSAPTMISALMELINSAFSKSNQNALSLKQNTLKPRWI
jgi:hypothetical protein